MMELPDAVSGQSCDNLVLDLSGGFCEYCSCSVTVEDDSDVSAFNECLIARLEEALDKEDGEHIPICKAVIENNVELLELLLQQPNIDLNHTTLHNNTALLLSLSLTLDDSLIMRLIEAGCDLNISNKCGLSPLHSAVLRSTLDITHGLLKKGCNVNIQDACRYTPLHRAVMYGRLEAVGMLLYYGADVNILDRDENTPFDLAFVVNCLDSARMLMNYYNKCDAVVICAKYINNVISRNILVELFGAANNAIDSDSCSLQTRTVTFERIELYEFPWTTSDWALFAYKLIPCISLSSFEWLKCVYTFFQSTLASKVMVAKVTKSCLYPYMHMFTELLRGCKNRNINRKDKLTLIYMYLNLGVEVMPFDIELVYEEYGFNEEFEAVVYCGDCNETFNFHCILRFILAVDNEASSKYFVKIFKKEFFRYESFSDFRLYLSRFKHLAPPINNYPLGFFALSIENKRLFRNSGEPVIREKLKAVPEVPSLVELGRNRVRTVIKQNCKFKKSYQFYDIVKNLNLPRIIQDIVCFKKPLY